MLANNLYPSLSTEPNPIVAVRRFAEQFGAVTYKVYGAFLDIALFTCKKYDSQGWFTCYVGVAKHVKGGTLVYVYESDAPKTL